MCRNQKAENPRNTEQHQAQSMDRCRTGASRTKLGWADLVTWQLLMHYECGSQERQETEQL